MNGGEISYSEMYLSFWTYPDQYLELSYSLFSILFTLRSVNCHVLVFLDNYKGLNEIETETEGEKMSSALRHQHARPQISILIFLQLSPHDLIDS